MAWGCTLISYCRYLVPPPPYSIYNYSCSAVYFYTFDISTLRCAPAITPDITPIIIPTTQPFSPPVTICNKGSVSITVSDNIPLAT